MKKRAIAAMIENYHGLKWAISIILYQLLQKYVASCRTPSKHLSESLEALRLFEIYNLATYITTLNRL